MSRQREFGEELTQKLMDTYLQMDNPSIRKVAEQFGLPFSAVQRLFNRLGVPTPTGGGRPRLEGNSPWERFIEKLEIEVKVGKLTWKQAEDTYIDYIKRAEGQDWTDYYERLEGIPEHMYLGASKEPNEPIGTVSEPINVTLGRQWGVEDLLIEPGPDAQRYPPEEAARLFGPKVDGTPFEELPMEDCGKCGELHHVAKIDDVERPMTVAEFLAIPI